MKILNLAGILRKSALGAIVAFSVGTTITTRAADHGDAPTLAHDQAADLADLYLFLDPNDNTKVIIIGTFHGFIVPGEAVNFAIFDPAVNYRFEIYNDHVNLAAGDVVAKKIKPNKTIDVTFSPRVGAPPASGPAALEVPEPQTASIALNGFEGVKKKDKFSGKVYNPSLAATAPPQETSPLGSTGILFFAGECDDPFFFDIPAFSRFVGSVRDGAPNPGLFSRARDSFAGYNALSIALSVPVDLLKGDNGNIVGVNFVAQRRQVEQPTKEGTVKSIGVFRNVDRIATPGVNVALVPFSRKNAFNAATPADDAAGEFVGGDESPKTPLGIVDTLLAFGTPPANIGILANVAVAYGDILKLDTSVPNTDTNAINGGGGDNAPAAFPNGRRLGDDVIDTVLSIIANTTLGDGVNASDVLPQGAFPFVALPQQPRDTGVVDDNTRN